MRKTYFLSSLVLMLFAVLPFKEAACQTGILADSIKNMLIRDWERAKDYTGDYMKAMPKDKFSFRATDSIRTFAQQLLHLAQANMFFVTIANGDKIDFNAPDLEKVPTAQSADSVMYYVNHFYDAAISAIRNTNATDFMKTSTLTMDKPYTATKLSWFMKAFEHQTHHRGQITIYLRLAGVKPPQERIF